MPFDVAFALPEDDALAYAVAFGEMSGERRLDWETMEWQRVSD